MSESLMNRSVPVLALAGGSGCGKSTLVQSLLTQRPDFFTVLPLDGYYLDRSQLSLEERSEVNFDHPLSIETELLILHLQELTQNRPVSIPIYDFTTHTRMGYRVLTPSFCILLEGTLVLSIPALRPLITVSVFMDTPDDLRLIRRIRRDQKERGRTIESILDQYVATVRPMYWEWIHPIRMQADFLLDGMKPVETNVKNMLQILDGVFSKTTLL